MRDGREPSLFWSCPEAPQETGVSLRQLRLLPATRCAPVRIVRDHAPSPAQHDVELAE